MRLADFILGNTESILVEWEAFARGIWPAPDGDPAELRDHAEEILRATAQDMRADQTEAQRADKSRGGGGAGGTASRWLDGASVQHGAGRVTSGFKLAEVVAEYRALRASVVRLWRLSEPVADDRDLDDLTRFHESIDQSLSEAVGSFTARVEQSRRLFLAILGHDLRNPLNALTLNATALAHTDPADVAEWTATAAQITASATAMARMIDDLLDFTGTGLAAGGDSGTGGGGTAGMPLAPVSTDLGRLCREVVDETRAAHPECAVRFESAGDLVGEWDPSRLRQVVSNLLGNAVQHGDARCEVRLTARGSAEGLSLDVHNAGEPIPPDALATIFDPLVRLASHDLQRRRRPGSLGLGLYIAREVVTAHGGTIDVTSSAAAGTTFTVRLPRRFRKRAN